MRTMTGWIAVLAALVAVGCAGQRAGVKQTGFLRDYSILKERDDEPKLYYVHPRADFSKYDKVLIEPVTVWASKDFDISDIPKGDLDRICGLLHDAISDEIVSRKGRQLVDRPGPGVMRLRLAITEASGAKVLLAAVASFAPPMIVITEAINLGAGTRAFVGTASIEAEVTDAMTGELLFAGIDRRQGGKGPTSKWGHVEDAMRHWARGIGRDLATAPRR